MNTSTELLRPERGLATELMSRPLLTAPEVGYLLGCDEAAVKYLHRLRQLPGVKVGKTLRWKPEAVQRYVDGLEPEGSA